MNKKHFFRWMCLGVLVLALTACGSVGTLNQESKSVKQEEAYRAIAYVTVPASENWRWIGTDGEEVVSEVDTRYLTHINFAFGMLEAYQFEKKEEGRPLMEGTVVSKEAYKNPEDNQYHYKVTVNGWIEEMGKKVEGGKYLSALVKLKEKKPELKVLLSIGGWDSDGFCYMARTREGRQEFIQSCIALMEEYHLDGIDLDWEYPSNGGWGAIVSCEYCVEDAQNLLKEFREALDTKDAEQPGLLTIASGIPWVDEETLQALDYMNVMCYDYSPGNGESQASLSYADYNMQAHAEMAGNTAENKRKINLGIPFYNEGGPYLVPYYKEWSGYVDASPEITRDKMNWVKKNGYGGGFYWAYSMDKFEQDTKDPKDKEVKILQRTLYETLNGKEN